MSAIATCGYCGTPSPDIDVRLVLEMRRQGMSMFCDEACKRASEADLGAQMRGIPDGLAPKFVCRICGRTTTDPRAAAALTTCSCGSTHWRAARS